MRERNSWDSAWATPKVAERRPVSGQRAVLEAGVGFLQVEGPPSSLQTEMEPVAGEWSAVERSKLLTVDLSFPGEFGGKEFCRQYRRGGRGWDECVCVGGGVGAWGGRRAGRCGGLRRVEEV